MKQTRMDSVALYLPQEIIRNILIRLPVRSLIRFRCVCKDWKNLIKTPSFISDHLQQSSHQNPSLLFECYRSNIHSLWRLRLLYCGLQDREVQKAPWIDSLEDPNIVSIVGSCNGLLLVEINQYNKTLPSLTLWNPATAAFAHVPVRRTDCFDNDDCVTGFGFSPIVNDYKIVRTYSYDAVTQVEVFSLSRGSWKGIDIGNLKKVKLNYETVTANGAIFWTGVKLGAKEEGEDDVEVIVSFDMAKEVFTLVSWPDLDYDAIEKLTVYENKLAILCAIWDDTDETSYLIDLLVLTEGTCASGGTWSWTKRYTGSPISCFLDSVTIWRNEIVYKPYFREDNERGRHVLYLMNVTTNEVKRFAIPYHGPIHCIYDHVESLVSVSNNDVEES